MDLTTVGQFRMPLGTEQWDIAHQNYNWNRVDGLLGAQNFTSTTRPSTNLFAGRLIWETDTLKLMRYNGTGWDQVGGASTGQITNSTVLTDVSYTSNTTLAAVAGLSVALVANAKYRIQGFISYTGVAAADIKFGLFAPAGATGRWSPQSVPSAAVSQVGDVDQGVVSFGSNLSAACNPTETCCCPVGYIATAATAGNLQVQAAQNAANATPTIIKVGSFLEVLRVA